MLETSSLTLIILFVQDTYKNEEKSRNMFEFELINVLFSFLK